MWHNIGDDSSGVDPIHQEVRSRMVYKHLTKRKFVSPKGYPQFEEVALKLALNIELAELGLELVGYRWIWLCAIDIMGRSAADNIFPVYRVDPELLSVFLEAEEPKQFGKIMPAPIESGLFLFPKGMIKIGKWEIDWLLVDTVDQSDRNQEYQFDKQGVILERLTDTDKRRYRWVTQTDLGDRGNVGDMFVSTYGYSQIGEESEKQYISISQSDIELTNLLTALSKHLWLWLYQPRKIEYVEVTRARGFGAKKNTALARYPIKLGLEEQSHKIYKPRPKGSSRAPRKSPVKHVRRAHWRNVPIGTREDGRRELRLIPRSIVNPEVNSNSQP